MPSYLSPGVYVEEVESGARPIEGVGTAVAAFVGLASTGPCHTPVLVTNWSQFTATFGEPVPGSYLAHAVYGYFLNGGGRAYVVRIGDGGDTGETAGVVLPAAIDPAAGAYVVTALHGEVSADGIGVEVTDAPEGSPDNSFRVVVRGGGRQEVFEPVTTRRGRSNVVSQVNATSTLIRLAETETLLTDRRPANTVVTVAARPTRQVARPDDYIGDAAARTGFGGLAAIDGITMVAVPDLMAAYQAGAIDREGVQAVQTAMIAHCESMGDRMAVLDAPPELNAQQVNDWRVTEVGYDSKFAALYWPWVKVFDPASGSPVLVPPSGHMAGVWARNDATRGVHKAPANEVVRGAIGVGTVLTRGNTTCSTPTGSTASGRSPAGASGSGARELCRPTRRGATSTCAGSTTTSSRR